MKREIGSGLYTGLTVSGQAGFCSLIREAEGGSVSVFSGARFSQLSVV
ncbi:MAG: hypothetical protein HQL67_01345 [Magnetococcales bacterium]|nr:hypothetical protein [Magnetococcales bacterium]